VSFTVFYRIILHLFVLEMQLFEQKFHICWKFFSKFYYFLTFHNNFPEKPKGVDSESKKRCPDKMSGDKTSGGTKRLDTKCLKPHRPEIYVTSVGYNIWRYKTSGGTQHPEGQNDQRQNPEEQSVRRDKTSRGTRRPEGENVRNKIIFLGYFHGGVMIHPKDV
jgi:hypothetical protein